MRCSPPAIHFASEGFPAYGRLASQVFSRSHLLTDPDAQAAYLPNGAAVLAGDLVVQAALARTLTDIAQKGPSALYSGAWVDEFLDRTRRDGGVLTVDDFAHYRAPSFAVLTGRNWEVHTSGANTAGPCLLRALKMCDQLGLHERGRRDADGFARLAETVDLRLRAHAPPGWKFHERCKRAIQREREVREVFNYSRTPSSNSNTATGAVVS